MGFDVKSLSQALKSDTASVKTGSIISFDVYSAVVNVDGQNITMKLLDSVTAALNKVVVCIVQGDTGFIIGTLDTTTRTPTASTGDAVSNSNTVPSVSYGTYTYTPNYTYVYNGTTGWESAITDLKQGITPYGTLRGFSFYGMNRFSGLKGKTITKVQVYVKIKSGTSVTLAYHGYGTKPAGSITTGSSQVVTSSGWVTVPDSWGTYLAGGTGTGGLAIIGTNVATAKGVPDGLTIKISWKK